MIETLTASDFLPLVGETVLFDQPDYQENFTLSEVIITNATPPPGMRQGFIVVLDGSNPNMMIEQGLYTLNIPRIGRCELGVNCIGKLENGAFQYQMVFN